MGERCYFHIAERLKLEEGLLREKNYGEGEYGFWWPENDNKKELLIVANPPAGSADKANYCNEVPIQERQKLTNVRFERDEEGMPYLYKFKEAVFDLKWNPHIDNLAWYGDDYSPAPWRKHSRPWGFDYCPATGPRTYRATGDSLLGLRSQSTFLQEKVVAPSVLLVNSVFF